MNSEIGGLIWTPSANYIQRSGMAKFMGWLSTEQGLHFEDYSSLWKWSVEHLEEFWQTMWTYFDIESSRPPEGAFGEKKMPGAEWFPGTRVNFAYHALRSRRPGKVAITYQSELRPLTDMTWDQLADDVASLGEFLRSQGVRAEDRVAAVLPNSPEAMTTLLASTAIGAIFSSCSPDFGAKTILDRFQQIEPKVLFVCDGYRFGGKDFDRRELVRKLVEELPSVETVVFMPYLFEQGQSMPTDTAFRWSEAIQHKPTRIDDFSFEDVDFSHPLWIVYSSGTTGVPKAMVHSHGGVALEYLKTGNLHANLNEESTLFFYTTTGWMMFNYLLSGLINGGRVVLYDGNPMAPDIETLWRLTEETSATVFGASPAFVEAMAKNGVKPKERYRLENLQMVILSGSPATPATFHWFRDEVKEDLWVTSQSGGTDIVSGFVGSVPILPVYAGEIQARCLGCDVHVVDDIGRELFNEVGELVVKQPMPSMPLFFWGDDQGTRYHNSYFDTYEGWWRHGDYMLINGRGGCYIVGRSDATLNRHGIRIGTAEIYRIVENVEGILDSLVVDLPLDDGRHFMPMFVAMKPDQELDQQTINSMCKALKSEGSPRHVPDQVIQVPEIPYTLTRKKLEVPMRKILMGKPVEEVVSTDAVANPDAIQFFVRWRDEFLNSCSTIDLKGDHQS